MPTKRPTKGDKFRSQILAEYDVDDLPGEHLLDALVSTIDELALLESDVRERGVTIEGARGQVVAHPGLAAIIRHRTLLAKLVKEMFPAADQETVSQKAARAARQRWRKEGVRR